MRNTHRAEMTTHFALVAILAVLLIAALALAARAEAAPTYEDQVMEIVNQERWANGQLPPLKRNSRLDTSSEIHSQNMADRDFFAHCDVDTGDLPWDRMVDAGYNWNAAAENISAGYSTPEAAMIGWMNSSGHRANILSTTTRELGIGYVQVGSDAANIRRDLNGDCTEDNFNNGPYYRYWTQNFGKVNSVYPVVIDREAYQALTRAVVLYVYGAGWAVDMRFRNEDGAWSSWEPYAADKAWMLSAGNGTKTVHAEIRNGATVRSAMDTIELDGDVTAVPGPRDVANALLRVQAPAPNPFRAGTRIAFELREAAEVQAAVFTVSGRRVTVLASGRADPGVSELTWDGRDASGDALPPGIYFISVRAGSERTTVKVVLAR